MVIDLPIGGFSRDYDSKKSVGAAINAIITGNEDGSFQVAGRTDGFSVFVDVGVGPIRSNYISLGGLVYVVSGPDLYQIDQNGGTTLIQSIGGAGQAQLIPDSNNTFVALNGLGDGWSVVAGVPTQISDAIFIARDPKRGMYLNGRWWFVDSVNANIFFGSDLNDPTSYSAAAVATAQQHADKVIDIKSKQSMAYVIGEKTIEIWQTVNDSDLPLRPITGQTIHHGTAAQDSVAELDNGFAFLGDDRAVYYVEGGNAKKISTLDFDLKVKGTGSLRFPGFTTVSDAIGFWVDGPIHKLYCLTFPAEGWTWCYDIVTGRPHVRESFESAVSIGQWRGLYSINEFSKTLVGDSKLGRIWKLDPASHTEGSENLPFILRTVSMSWDKDVVIDLIELEMEVGVTKVNDDEALMQCRISKDGGKTWLSHRNIGLGDTGHYNDRPQWRQIGRVPARQDFVVEWRTSADVDIRIYKAKANVMESVF